MNYIKNKQLVLNIFADISYIGILFCVYSYANYYKQLLSYTTNYIIAWLAIIFIVISIINQLIWIKGSRKGKSYLFFYALKKIIKAICRADLNARLSASDKRIVFAFLVKMFYIPLMLNFSVQNFYQFKHLFQNMPFTIQNVIEWFNTHFYFLMIAFVFLIDTLVFTFGYLFEAKFLKNEIKSVDNTFLGWFFTLICYPPLNEITGKIIPWVAKDSALFFNSTTTFIVRIIILILLIIYVSATISLGTKASNLTNRGIVQSGMYAYVRHPAYIAKNMVWFITAIPAILSQPLLIFSPLAWFFIYYMRAITEERHLLKDVEYQKYCKKVKYRFIPYVI